MLGFVCVRRLLTDDPFAREFEALRFPESAGVDIATSGEKKFCRDSEAGAISSTDLVPDLVADLV